MPDIGQHHGNSRVNRLLAVIRRERMKGRGIVSKGSRPASRRESCGMKVEAGWGYVRQYPRESTVDGSGDNKERPGEAAFGLAPKSTGGRTLI